MKNIPAEMNICKADVGMVVNDPDIEEVREYLREIFNRVEMETVEEIESEQEDEIYVQNLSNQREYVESYRSTKDEVTEDEEEEEEEEADDEDEEEEKVKEKKPSSDHDEMAPV